MHRTPSTNQGLRSRTSNAINLNNICKVVSSQRVSLNADQESSPSHGLLPFHRQSCSKVAAGRAPLQNRNTSRCWRWISVVGVCECSCLLLEHWHTNSAAPSARPFNSTSTRRRRDGFLSFRTFLRQSFKVLDVCITNFRVSCYLFFPFRWIGILCFTRVCQDSA